MKKTLHHSTKILIEIVVAGVVIALIGIGALAWKLSQGPIDLEPIIPYIQEAFQDLETEETAEIGSLYLEWQGAENPLGLNAKDVVISNNRGPFLYAPEIDLNLSLRSLLIGRLKFETVWVRQIALSVTKTERGDITITGHNRAQDAQPETENDVVPATLSLNDLIYDLPTMDVLWIDKARIIYQDNVADITRQFDPVTFYIEIQERRRGERNLLGFLTFPFGDSTTNNIAKMNFSTEGSPVFLNLSGIIKDMPIDSLIQFLPPLPEGFAMDMMVSAALRAQLDNDWAVNQMNLKIDADEGALAFPLNDNKEELTLSNTEIHLKQNSGTNTLDIETFKARINDTVDLNVTGSLISPNSPDHMSGNVNLSVVDLPQSYLPQYWPQDYADNGAYRWLTEKISGGVFNTLNLTAVFDMAETARTDNKPLPPELLTVSGDMTFTGVDIDYNAPMAPAKQVNGAGEYDDVELSLNIDSATVGGMTINNGTLYFDDLITSGSGLGTLHFPVTSDAQSVFDYIAAEPISAFENIDFKGKNAQGNVKADIDVEIPLLKDVPMDDIKVTVKGTVTDAAIPNAVRGLTLSGGPYEIEASTQDIKVKGSGLLQGKAITLDWHEYFSPESARAHEANYVSKVDADVVADDAIRRAFTNDFADYFRGDSEGKVSYIKSANNRDATIDLDLNLLQTHVMVPPLGIDKPSGQASKATTTVRLQNGDLSTVKNLRITGKGLSIGSGDLSFRSQNNEPLITKATLKNVTFDENRIDVSMVEEGGALKTDVTGSFLDARPILTRQKSEGDGRQDEGRPREYSVNVDKMRTADDYNITRPKAFIRLDRMGQAERFELDGNLGEGGQFGDLHIRYTPDVESGLSLRVESNNAGETLRAFDLYPYVKGGELQISGMPLPGGRFGDVKGRARINNFSVAQAPVLLRLVNALSFQSFMNAGVLSFSRLESDFEWLVGEAGDIYRISEGRTSGAGVALTFDGYIDMANQDINVTGTAAPLSELNSFVGKIPLIGDLLTGGDALLAATYSIRGNPSDPSVGVNPLSILTPGIIRKMLFENTPEPEGAPNEPTQQNQNYNPPERTSNFN